MKKIEYPLPRISCPERRLLETSDFKKGYNIKCRFCGHFSAEHTEVNEVKEQEPDKIDPEWHTRKKGYRFSLNACPGYIPSNLREWGKLAKAEEKRQEAELQRRYGYLD